MRNIVTRIRQLSLAQSLVLLDYLGIIDRRLATLTPDGKGLWTTAEEFVARYCAGTPACDILQPITFVGGPSGTKLFPGRYETFVLDRAFAAIKCYGYPACAPAIDEAEIANRAFTRTI